MEGALSPHGGKIMIELVFMGHDITSVGGSVELWLLEGMGDCNTLGGVSCWRDFFVVLFFFIIIQPDSLLFTGFLRPLVNTFMTLGEHCFQPHDNSSLSLCVLWECSYLGSYVGLFMKL